MTSHLHPSIWTLEIDGKPTLAFEAKKYAKRTSSATRIGCASNWASKNSMASRCAVPTQA